MKKKWLITLFAAAALFFVAGCGNNQEQALEHVAVETHEETRTLGEQNQITITLSYPVISSENDNKIITALNDKFQTDAEDFVHRVETEYGANAPDTAEYQYVAEEAYNEQGMLSIVQNATFYDGSVERYAATYNLANGKKMTLGEVLNMKEKEAEAFIIQQFGGVIQTDPNTFYTDAADYIENNLDQMQYYRNAGGLSVFFQAGEIAPVSAGILEIVIQ